MENKALDKESPTKNIIKNNDIQADSAKNKNMLKNLNKKDYKISVQNQNEIFGTKNKKSSKSPGLILDLGKLNLPKTAK